MKSLRVRVPILFCLFVVLRQSAPIQHGSYHGNICSYSSFQNEFNKTMEAVKKFVHFTRVDDAKLLTNAVYMSLYNDMVNTFGCHMEIEIPAADGKMVDELEKAGFADLADLARMNYCRGNVNVKASKFTQSYAHKRKTIPMVRCVKTDQNVLSHGVNQNETTNRHLDPGVRVIERSYCHSADTHESSLFMNISNNHCSWNSGNMTNLGDSANTRGCRKNGRSVIEEDLYWSVEIEAATPKGFSERQFHQWKNQLPNQSVKSMEPGNETKCGREKNRFIVLRDSSKLCARNRAPFYASMTGELYSYHLARMLGITNLPPLTVSIATTEIAFWKNLESNFEATGWKDGQIVLITKWIEGLESAYFPETLITKSVSAESILHLPMKNLTILLQWSDLIVFDYLIAHFDRLTVTMTAAKMHDPLLMWSKIHNLLQHPRTGQLWIVDNESGLLDGYSVVMSTSHSEINKSLVTLHEELLQKVCVFRRSTVERVRALLHGPYKIAKLLTDRVLREEPVSRGVFVELDKIKAHSKMLESRLKRIYNWMEDCRKRNKFHP